MAAVFIQTCVIFIIIETRNKKKLNKQINPIVYVKGDIKEINGSRIHKRNILYIDEANKKKLKE